MNPEHRPESDESKTSKAVAALADNYVRTNISALEEIGGNHPRGIDARTGAALCRRGLLWEQPKGHWHLTGIGSRALDLLDAERTGNGEEGEAS